MSTSELLTVIEALERTEATLAGLVNSLPESQLTHKPINGEFSIIESLCHLRDIEIEGYSLRINRILSEDQPHLPDIDGGKLAVERDYNKQDVHEALRSFSLARMENLNVLRKVGADELGREGTLEGVGAVTLEKLLMLIRDHDAGHINDIERIRASLSSGAI